MDTASRHESLVWQRRAKCQGMPACFTFVLETRFWPVREGLRECLHFDLLAGDGKANELLTSCCPFGIHRGVLRD